MTVNLKNLTVIFAVAIAGAAFPVAATAQGLEPDEIESRCIIDISEDTMTHISDLNIFRADCDVAAAVAYRHGFVRPNNDPFVLNGACGVGFTEFLCLGSPGCLDAGTCTEN